MEILQPGWTPETPAPGNLVVIVVTFNSGQYILRCLDALRDRYVLVIDNNSQDNTRALIRANFPAVRVVGLSDNVGLSAAFNIGWRSVKGRDVLFLNPDVVVDPAGVDLLRAAVRQLPHAAAVAPRLLNPDGTTQLTARTFPTVQSSLARRTPLGRSAWGRKVVTDHLNGADRHGSLQPVDWALGAALLIPAESLVALGGFDENFFLYCEDVDYCARGWLAGLGTYYYADVSFHHEYQRASRRSWNLASRATRAHLVSTLLLIRRYPRQFLGRPLRNPEHRS